MYLTRKSHGGHTFSEKDRDAANLILKINNIMYLADRIGMRRF